MDDGRKVFQLSGPTGYEGFYIDEKTITDFRDASESCEGWLACFGTKGVYDKLLVPLNEMRKALGINSNQQQKPNFPFWN